MDLCQIHSEEVWSLAWTSLNVKVKGQGHQEQQEGQHPLTGQCAPPISGGT